MPTEPNKKPWEDNENDGDDERDQSEVDETESVIYDDDNDDEKYKAKTQQARRELLNFLQDWLETNEDVVWTKTPNLKESVPGVENKEAKEEIPELYSIYFNIDAILRQAIGKESDKIKHYKELLQRLSPWVMKGKGHPSHEYNDHGEVSRLEYFIKNWELKDEEQYTDAKEDINNAIDNIKAHIRGYLVNWRDEKLTPLIPLDLDTQKEQAKNELLEWEKDLIKGSKDWLTSNKKQNAEGHEVELTKKEQGLLKAIFKQAEQAIKSKKIEIHHKLVENMRIKFSQLIEETIPEPGEAVPEASHYKELIKAINAGTNLFKNWSDLLTQIAKPKPEVENARKVIKFIDFSLIKDKLSVYNEFVKKVKEVKNYDELKPFEICTTGGGTDCLNHPEGGNWLPAWKKAVMSLKKLEKERERAKEDKDKPPCECLHCTHGLGKWTWIFCPFYDNSIFKDKEISKQGTIMSADNAPHWVPPIGWTPFYNPTGTPRENKINNRTNSKIHKEVKWKYEPREEHGGLPRIAQTQAKQDNKGKKKETYNFPSAQYEPAAQSSSNINIHGTPANMDEVEEYIDG